MKCKNTSCNKIAKSGRWYCSKECAPYGTAFAHGDTSSMVWEGCTPQVHGDRSPQLLKGAWPVQQRNKSVDKAPIMLQNEHSLKENIMQKTETKLENKNASDGSIYQIGNERNSVSKELQNLNALTPEALLDGRLQIIGQEESESMNSIDACVKSLSELMQSARKNLDKSEAKNAASIINASANCAGQIQKLLKLKIEVAKERRNRD